MVWYPQAKHMPLPEFSSQPAIHPTQVIFHSASNDFHMHGTYNYFKDNATKVESHFGVLMAPDPAGRDGEVWQFMDTDHRADAQADANPRAISIETDSSASDAKLGPWSPRVIDSLVELTVWLCGRYQIPVRQCPGPTQSGIGWHRLFPAWNPNDHYCPGAQREKQIRDIIIPRVNEILSGDGMSNLTPGDFWGYTNKDLPDGDKDTYWWLRMAKVAADKSAQQTEDIDTRLNTIESKLDALVAKLGNL
jgi:hypothetical protein